MLTDATCAVFFQITIIYFAGVMIILEPVKYSSWALGFALSIVMVALLALAVVLQIVKGNSKKELEQSILESEAREIDMMLSIKELQADTERFAIATKAQHVDTALSRERRASERLAHEGGDSAYDGTRMVHWKIDISSAGNTRSPMWFQTPAGPNPCLKDKSDGFTSGAYPCYVVSHTNLCRYSRLPVHEDALADEKLGKLKLGSRNPSPSHSYFISQNWEGAKGSANDTLVKMHPDNAMNSKLRWLQNLKRHLSVPEETEVWIWWDGISVPQRDRDAQRRAVGSLCFYCQVRPSALSYILYMCVYI